MIPILKKRILPGHPLLKRSLGRPRLRTGARTLAIVSRHIGWALGVTSKFGCAARWPGLQPRAMIFARGSMLRIMRLQPLLRHVPSAVSALRAAALSLERPLRPNGLPGLPATASQSAALSASGVPGIRMTHLPAEQKLLRFAGSSPSGNVYTTRKRTIDFVERIMALPIARSVALRAAPADSAPFSPGRMHAPRRMPLDESQFNESGLPGNVLRKHRRIEDRAFLCPRDAKSTVAAAAMIPEGVVAHRPRARNRTPEKTEMPFESGPRTMPHSPAPAVNVAQITEAVLQQLDRRLIAARERMGRI